MPWFHLSDLLTLVVMDAQTSSKESSLESQHRGCETNFNTPLTAVVQLCGLAGLQSSSLPLLTSVLTEPE